MCGIHFDCLVARWPGGRKLPISILLDVLVINAKGSKKNPQMGQRCQRGMYDPLVVYYMGNYDDCCHGSWFMLNFNDHPFIYDDGRGSL